MSVHGTTLNLLKSLTLLLPSHVLCLALAAQTGSAPDQSVAFRRADHLKRGINTSHWFSQVYDPKGYTPEHFQGFTTADDIALIRQMGFDHVRFSINPVPFLHSGQWDNIPADYLAELDKAVNMILSRELAVIIDLHPESDFKRKLASDNGAVEQLADLWRALAAHFASTDPERVFFEVLNEPELEDGYRWKGIQSRVVAAIRKGAPGHTIIAAGARWSALDELLFMEPLGFENIIYNFHYYSPHIFTHQGATWAGNLQHYMKGGVPYPSSPAMAGKLQSQVPDELDRLYVTRYAYDAWGPARIEAEIALAEAWAHQYNVPLTCNEFGVYRNFAAPDDRAAWIRDVRTILEKHGIGWTMWDYSGAFGVVTKKDGKATVDHAVLKALGLEK
ncbi:MAG TPA: glycoside hydrolase family 5 protein [Terriglobales bacterium]|nr:glycoside hydrolase family 5 protein [Terriglobales bacterium]